ncbi:MAG: hypothetical protein M0R80_04395 [Proteobacteria bacterium]|jgi:hypothetical protein|nr:hypothetical protein [Pseudomonadota bacterium]
MTKNWSRFPLAEPTGEDLANFSVYRLYEKSAIAGYGVLSGCEVTRTSSTAVTAASGTFTISGVSATFAGASLTGIAAAAATKHRYDLVYIDGTDSTLKIESGVEEVPDNAIDFLENYSPRPAEPTDTDWIVLAIIRVTEDGITESDFGTIEYATDCVADMRLSPAFAVDDVTLQVINGVASVKAMAGHASNHASAGSDPIKLDDLAAPENNTDLNVSALAHGLCPMYPNNTTTFFRGDGTYAVPGSDSTKINHSLATATSDFLVGNTGGGTFVKKTLAETKTVLGLGSAAYTASGDYATAAKGVTNGDSHNHVGGDGAVLNVAVWGPYRITHDGGATQAIVTTPALCEIDEIVVKCQEGSTTATILLGWAGDTDGLMTNAEAPKTLNLSKFIRFPTSEFTSATALIATVGGADTVGEWDVWLKISRYT